MYSRLPMIVDKHDEQFWFTYNKLHAEEHQDMANWINALAKAKSLDLTISYYQSSPFDPNDKEAIKDFFYTNWKQHQLFYDFLNKIGQSLTVPVYVFPKNYPSFEFDMDVEFMLKLEKDIHNMLWRTIDVIESNP